MGQDYQLEVIDLLRDLQKRIGYIEKKIDLLSGKSSDKSFKPRSYSPSSRPSGGSRYKGKQESSFEAKKAEPSRWYEKKRGGGERGAAKIKKKAYKPTGKKNSDKSK